MKINYHSCLYSLLRYMKEDYSLDPCNWKVSDLFGSILLFSPGGGKMITHTGDPAYWYDWKGLVEEEVAKDKTILDEENGLTLEQGLVAIQYFLEQRYWVKDNDMLLKDAYDDLVAEYNANKDKLESSQLWQEWLVAVAEGKKFDKIFRSGE